MDATNAEDRDEARRLWNLQEDEGDRRSPSFQEEYNGSVANGSEPEEFEDAHERIPSAPDADHSIHGYYAPFDAQLDVTSDFLPREPIFVSETEARAVLQSEMSKVTETQPSQRMLTGLHWNRDWLDKAVFVFKDPRTHLRLKLLANCYHDADDITDILNMAWRFGYKFHLFIPMEDAVKFRTPNIADIDILTLPRINESGFTERFMTKVNGQQAQFATWMASAKEVTSRPNAVAFISEGGMTSAIARVVNTDLVRLFVKGPSPQVTELGKGEVFLQQNPPDGGPPRFLTTDQTSEAEKLILHGFIPGATNDADKTLFPLQHTFELESDHVHGMIGDFTKGIYTWRTEGQWRSYLRQNNRGAHAPAYIPTDADFETVGALMRRAFPVSWQQLPLRGIRIPEDFDPRAHGDWGAL
ncbi:hypothetical protein C8R46DRAFT_910054 [Mycena filopes]|nr:hypothetical protein C8R46DRAFT_910054 [Mycena filopes]